MNSKWNKFLLENGDRRIVSFDFDDTLLNNVHTSNYSYDEPNWPNINKLKQFAKDGYIVYIVTRRDYSEQSVIEIDNFIKHLNLPVKEFYFTNNEDKVHRLKELGVNIHFDDDKREIDAIAKIAPEIKGILVSEDLLPGGQADDMNPKNFDNLQLKKGIAHEMEHTDDWHVAREIAMDHLIEDPKYYDRKGI